MADIIVVSIISILLGCAIAYMVKEKKAGARCIGCSLAGKCGSKVNACESEKSDVNPLVKQYYLNETK